MTIYLKNVYFKNKCYGKYFRSVLEVYEESFFYLK